MKKNFLVQKHFINIRLDKWLRNNICKVPQSLIEKNIRKGKIKVNNKKTKSSYKVQKDDQISIYNLNFEPDKNKKKLNRYVASKKELSYSSNLFIENNENFVVINKPTGIAVQSGTKSRKNILDILNSTKEFNNTTPYAVHRIDKDTSGILIVAKNREYAQLLTTLFRIRKIHKTYLGIILGEPKSTSGTFSDILVHYEGEKKIKSKAITHFRVIDSNYKYSLLQLSDLYFFSLIFLYLLFLQLYLYLHQLTLKDIL